MNDQLHSELLMSEIEGYTKVVFRFRAKKFGKCYFIDHRCQLKIPISLTKSVVNYYEDGNCCQMWIKTWFYEKNKDKIIYKLKQ